MDRVAHSISLDLRDSIAKVFIPVKQNDTGRTLRISLTDGDEPYEIAEDCTAVLRGTKPDGHPIFNDGEIINNRIVCEITPQMVAVLGEVLLEVSLFGGNGEQVTSARFGMAVLEKTLSDERVESSAEFTALQKIMSEAGIPEFKRRLQEMEVAINESRAATENAVQKTNDAVTEAERISSEAAAQAKNISEAAANTANQAANYAITTADNASANAIEIANRASANAVEIAERAATDAASVASSAASESLKTVKEASEDAKTVSAAGAQEAVRIATKAAEDASAMVESALEDMNSMVEEAQAKTNEAASLAYQAAEKMESAVSDAYQLKVSVEEKLRNGEFTPKVGIDFFTETDQQAMVDKVLLRLPQDIKITTWKGIQEVIRAGKVSEILSVGDQIECQHSRYGTLLWDVIGIDHDTPVDPQYSHSVTLQLHDCIFEQLKFDAPEPDSPISHYRTYGSNIWGDSAIRQWLNSKEGFGNWWSAQTEEDLPPEYAATLDGFMKGLDADFVDVLGPVLKISALNDYSTTSKDAVLSEYSVTEDTFFLLSISEVYGGLNYGLAEGVAYPYYVINSTSDKPGVVSDAARIKFREDAAAQWLLRSVYQDGSVSDYDIRCVKQFGQLARHGGYNLDGIAPACCIY